MICVVPVVLGHGTPLFKPGHKIGLELIATSRTDSGALVNCYRVEQAT